MQRFISGNIYFFTGRVILYLLKRQQTVTQSITKVKYYALAKAIFKILWLKQIIGQIIYLSADIKSVPLYGDN